MLNASAASVLAPGTVAVGVQLLAEPVGVGLVDVVRHQAVTAGEPLRELDRVRALRGAVAEGDLAARIEHQLLALQLHLRGSADHDEAFHLAQVEVLAANRCDAFQGYYFSAPLSATQVGDVLKQRFSGWRAENLPVTKAA